MQKVLIVPASDSHSGVTLSLECGLPVMIITNTISQARAAHDLTMSMETVIGIVVADERALGIVEEGIRTLMMGTPYRDPRLERSASASNAVAVALLRQEFGVQDFSQRDIDFLLLEAQDISNEELAKALQTTVNVVYKLRSRLCQRLDITAAQLRRLARRIAEKVRVEEQME